MPYLTIKDLSKSFSKNRVLDNIDLEIERGSFCVLLGPSGCGKSTLLNIVAGLESADQGRVILGGQDITDLPPHKRDIAMVFQNYALYPHLTVYENLAFGLRARQFPKQKIDEKVRQVSRILSIEDKLDAYPRQISGGQQQRVATGRAIVRDPRLFLFDEPLSNLDARLRIEVRKEFLRLQNELEITSLYVTHDQSEALALGDHIVVLKDAVIQQQAVPQALYQDPENLFVAQFIGTPPMNIIKGTLQRQAERLILVQDGFRLDIPKSYHALLKAQIGEAVYWGQRPAHIALSDSGMSAEIEFSELMEEAYLTYLKLEDGLEIKVLVPRIQRLHSGERVHCRFDERKMFFFTAQGRRIRSAR